MAQILYIIIRHKLPIYSNVTIIIDCIILSTKNCLTNHFCRKTVQHYKAQRYYVDTTFISLHYYFLLPTAVAYVPSSV